MKGLKGVMLKRSLFLGDWDICKHSFLNQDLNISSGNPYIGAQCLA